MDEFTDWFEFDYSIHSSIDSDETDGYLDKVDHLPDSQEHDIWARRALATNGFGDY